MPKVDVLMAVRNGSRFIAPQIESILGQDHQDIHLYIRDNHSLDETETIVASYLDTHPEKITWISSNQDLGPAGNFSRLMERSRSPYAMFSDHDDIWLKNKVSRTLAKAREIESRYSADTPVLIHTDLRVVDEQLETIAESLWRHQRITPLHGRAAGFKAQLMQNSVTGNTVLMNRTLLLLATPIPEEAFMHDWWVGLVAAAFGAVASIPDQTILYRQHEFNDTGARSYGFSLERLRSTRSIRAKLLAQTDRFSSRYASVLDADQKALLDSFRLFLTSSPFRKLQLMIGHGFYKNGLLRNLKELIIP